MYELVTSQSNDRFPVSGRMLHEQLMIKEAYTEWTARMISYGFIDGSDFIGETRESTGGRPSTNHLMSYDMAKHVCMLQRTPKGMEIRQHLINLENQWNTPEAVMARALKMANDKLEALNGTVRLLTATNDELKPKAAYCDLILLCPDAVPVNTIAKDYGRSAVWLNRWPHEQGVQYKQGDIWLLYADYADKGYVCTRTHNATDETGSIHSKVHTYWTQKGRKLIYDLLKEHDILPLTETAIEGRLAS